MTVRTVRDNTPPGIHSAAPAINWDRFIPAELWPQIVMRQELGGSIAQCKLGVASQAAVASCDGLDGVVDGVVDDPRRCDFDPSSLVGTSTPCGDFTADDARVLQMIWDGPRGSNGEFLWYGLAKGAPLNFLAGTFPFPIATDQVFDSFGALVEWVEEGNAPDRIVASRVEGSVTVRTRPLCPYPYVARYDRKGDPNSADSFECKPN